MLVCGQMVLIPGSPGPTPAPVEKEHMGSGTKCAPTCVHSAMGPHTCLRSGHFLAF